MEKVKRKTLINISRKAFIQVTALLLGLLIFSIVLTYVVPKGKFGTLPSGEVNYLEYIPIEDAGGISVIRGILASDAYHAVIVPVRHIGLFPGDE